MIEKAVIERLLTANGVDPSAPDEEIKSVLFSAKWHEADVETALMVLRENSETHAKRVDSLHKVFRTDEKLDSAAISALLGIVVDIPPHSPHKKHKDTAVSIPDAFVVVFVSVLLSGSIFLLTMWYLKIGIFNVLT